MKSQTEIIIQCIKTSPRLAYIAKYLSSALQITILVGEKPVPAKESKNSYVDKRKLLINYSENPIDGAFNVFANGLLHETEIGQPNPGVFKRQEQTMLFPAPPGFDLPFDLFSAAFYLLSRYEEYLPFKPDRYGRFEADQSLAFRNNFLEEPVIDQWLEMLKTALQIKYPELNFPRQQFRYVSTIDVDNPWAFLHKGPWRTAGGLFKNIITLNAPELSLRINVLRGKSPDPFDTFAYIGQTENNYGFRSLFFFLSGNQGHNDTNFALNTNHFQLLLDRLKTDRTIGIHPSCKSNRSDNLLRFEFERFTRLLGNKPEISRQHFLMLKLPYTYRRIIKFGIKEDYSMGYASCTGFRAGTSMPFGFYDLLNEHETSLLIHPFVVMDVTLRHYLCLDTAEAINRINRLIKKVKAVNGIFTSLWHNESLSEQGVWQGWRQVFEGMVEEGTRDKGPGTRQGQGTRDETVTGGE
jgi:hypothetical protein